MKNILFVASDDAGQEARLQCALDVARAIGGHLNCLSIVKTPIPIGELAVRQRGEGAASATLTAARNNRTRLMTRLQSEGIPFSWQEAAGTVVDAIVDHALLNDLVVVGSYGAPDEWSVVDIAAQLAGRLDKPVLAVPHEARSLDLFGTAIVAWDGSDVAAGALRAALPLLGFAQRVEIVTARFREGEFDVARTAEVADFCARNGVKAKVTILEAGFGKTWRVLLGHASAIDADWIAMGFFGHSRLRENLIGGVTRGMIENSQIPLLLAR